MEHTMTSPAPYPRRWWALVVLSIGLLVISLDNTILNVALPSLSDDLGASSSQLQWIVDAYMLVFAGLLLTVCSVGAGAVAGGADRRPLADGHRRRADHAVDPVDRDGHVPRGGAPEGDRHLGGGRGDRDRDRPRRRRVARRACDVALGLPRQRPVRAGRARRRAGADSRVARPE